MDPRARWQALQRHLADAQRFLAAGDHAAAHAEVDAALQLDPDFLAAHSLRERITRAAAMRPIETHAPAPSDPSVTASVQPPDFRDGFAAFEDRVRTRRAERRADAARRALAQRRLREAAAAIDEIRELKPDLPQLANLEALYDLAAGSQPRSSTAVRWLTAAAAFACVVFAASVLERSGVDSGALLGYPMFPGRFASAPLIPGGQLTADDQLVEPDDVAGRIEVAIERPVATTLSSPGVEARPAIATQTESFQAVPTTTLGNIASAPVRPIAPPPGPASMPVADAPVARVAVEPMPRVAAGPAVNNAPAIVAPPPAPVDEERLIRGALQQYQSAYEELDARSARAVWPAVDERALARAFDDLESQSVMFDNCDVQLNGGAASAVCRGRMRYVAKVGSREPRTEPRVWTFTLRKNGDAWQIASARVDR